MKGFDLFRRKLQRPKDQFKELEEAKEHAQLGRIYLGEGIWDKAVEEFEKALGMNPGDPGTRLRLSYALLQMGLEDRAYEEYRRAWEPYTRNKIVARLIEAYQQYIGTSHETLLRWPEEGRYGDPFPVERGYAEDPEQFESWLNRQSLFGFEYKSTPDVEFYPFVLENLDPDDVVLDLGAGDLRLDILMAERVKKVYAVEVNPILLGRALQIIGYDLPRNLIVICANLFDVEIPKDATVVVILMRHCTRREEIFKRFKKLKIITNFGGELIIKDKRD
ncbi:MAG: hypothetical protein QXD04_07565 [Candidatus Bathyarchaeia archaeon]